MTTENDVPVPRLGSEAGLDIVEDQKPVRVSGFICAALGVLSVLCLLGRPLLVFPFLAVAAGLFALRPSGGVKPVGKTAAKVGVVLAIGFGSCGFFLHWFTQKQLGGEAAFFAQEYLEIIARGELEMAMELGRPHQSRNLETTPLKEHYSQDEQAQEALMRFRSSEVTTSIQSSGLKADWVLDRRPRVYERHGRQLVDLQWIDRTGTNDDTILMTMEYQIDEAGVGQWSVDSCRVSHPPVFADRVA